MIASLPLLAALAAAPHPLDARDMQSMDRVGNAVASPDGRQIVFVVTSTDVDANKRSRSLWWMRPDGSGLKRLTTAGSDDEPQWSSDSATVFFVSKRSGKPQVWRIVPGGGEAEQVTDEPIGVSALRLSPDGTRLAFAQDAFPDCPDAACTRKRLDGVAASKQTGQVFDNLFVRHWDTWSNGTRNHLFTRLVSGGPSVDVMRGFDADVPSKPFGDTADYAFMPDSKWIAFSARNVGREEAWSTHFDLYSVPVDGSAKPRNFTPDNKGTAGTPVFSPDGKTLAFTVMPRPRYASDRRQLMLRAWPTGTPRPLAESWDRSPDELVWSHDGKTLFAGAEDHGHGLVFAIDVASGSVTALTHDGTAHGIAQAGESFDRLVFAQDNLRAPAELVSIKLDGSERAQLTHFNAARLAQVTMGVPERFQFAGAKGDSVEGWIIKPAGFNPGRKYPVAFIIHGGPQGSFLDQFHYRWNGEVFAAHGYGVVMIDFHGSTGYGQAFTDAIRDDWGGAPFEDLQKGLEAALGKNPWMDAKNVCALGASFGGWMIDWIAGAWPDRFKCLVSHDGNLDERAAYFDTEELWFPEWEHRGTPWDNPGGYVKHNPVDLVGKWKTPILIIHGGQDFRVVATEGLSAFTAAQRRGIPSKLLYFPDENHWVLKPQNSVQWHATVLQWLAQWTGRK
jgi:dipeptidyl aminopeptidase/acylaminoacyl peptidase